MPYLSTETQSLPGDRHAQYTAILYLIHSIGPCGVPGRRQGIGSVLAGSAAQIDREVDFALQQLYASNSAAKKLAANAKGILVFPNIVKAGFMFGGQYGRGGALRVRGRTAGYYQSLAASYGLQAVCSRSAIRCFS